MDYKDKLKELRENEEWDKLLSSSLELFEKDSKDRHVVRMIVLAYEKLDKETDAVRFWEILAKGENRPEEFSKKLITYHRKTGEKELWIKWARRLLFQSLKKRDFPTLEDLWMQLIEAEAIDKTFAFEVISKIESSEEKERAFTLLELFLLSLEEKEPLSKDVLDVAKRLLEIEDSNVGLRRKIEGFFRIIYTGCTQIEDFIEKAGIGRSENVSDSIKYLEKLMNLCPGRYVSHKNWGIGKVCSVDILFDKVLVNFSGGHEQTISLDLAFNILSPLNDDDFPVLRIEKRDFLLTLKKENPAELIKLLLKKEETIPQDRVKTLLKSIVKDDEWHSFLEKLKKATKSEDFTIKRKGNKYLFTRAPISRRKGFSIKDVESKTNPQDRLEMLFSISNEGIKPDEKEMWVNYAEEILKNRDIALQAKVQMIFTLGDVSSDKKRLKKDLDILVKNVEENEQLLLIDALSQKQHKKEFLQYLGEKDYKFAEKIFLKTSDRVLRNTSQKIIEKKGDMKQLSLQVIQNPFKHPLCFLYLAEMVMKDKGKSGLIKKPIILFETLIEFLAKRGENQKARSRAKGVFSKYGFDIFKWALETSSKEEIRVLLDIIKVEISIDSQDKKVFERLAETKHPSLKEKESDNIFYVTKESMNKKKQELDHLLHVEIPANSEEIGKAARQGDLSENFDYISAKEKQKRLFDRATMLKDELPKARPIEDVVFVEGEVGIGTRVVLESKEEKGKREILILGPWDNIPHKEVVSHTSPLADELLGKKIGETFFDKFCKKEYRIASVEKYKK